MDITPFKKLEQAITAVISKNSTDTSNASQAAREIMDLFSNLCIAKKFNILLTRFNMPDGLGDLVNLISYLTQFKFYLHGFPITNIDNEKLLALLFNVSDIDEIDDMRQATQNFFKNSHIGIGYLQDPENSTLSYRTSFIMLVASTCKKLNCDIIINLNKLDLSSIEPSLKNLGIGRVAQYSNDGIYIKTNIINESGIFVRLIDYAGLSNADIDRLFHIADVCAGSGDNSLSYVIASNCLPYIGILGHKLDTMLELINYISRNKLDSNGHLSIYLNMLCKTATGSNVIKYDIDDLCQYATKNHDSFT